MTDLNEMAENAKKREEALDALAELSQELEKSRKIYEHDNDTWWNGLNAKKREEALDALAELSQELEKSRKIYENDNDTWWNGLTEQEREDAFYAVCKRIWKADGIDNGTYRYGLYDVFGFDPGMYARGMDCGYMAIHNAIFDGEELQRMKRVTRFEVIDDAGRSYTKYLKDDERVKYVLQDDNRTLKVFIDKLNTEDL